MAQAITADDEAEAEELRDEFTDEFDVPDGWAEDREEFPVSEAVVESDMPDDYLPQFQIAGYETDTGAYVGVWWLRDGERLQVFYDTDDGSWYGGVGGVEHAIGEIEDEF